jgi:predicted HAD superfamily phosphohydrolase YqeG
MKVYDNELTLFCDVDDTLVMWKDNPYEPGDGKIKILDPNDLDEPYRYLYPHHRHINFIKKCKNRGYNITVWSNGGWAWAKAVVEALHLQDYVTKVESKPLKIIDDLPYNETFPNRLYLDCHEGSE